MDGARASTQVARVRPLHTASQLHINKDMRTTARDLKDTRSHHINSLRVVDIHMIRVLLEAVDGSGVLEVETQRGEPCLKTQVNVEEELHV